MFEKIAKSFQTAVLVVLVVLLSAVFVLQFGGPQAQGCSAGGATYAAKVYGDVITEGDFEAAYRLGGFDRQSTQRQRSMDLKRLVLNGLVERSLLAREARELGFHVEDKEVMRRLLEDGKVQLSLGVDAPGYLPQGEVSVARPDQDFGKEQAKRLIQNYLRRSVAEFTTWQVEERLAARMRDSVRASVTVSPREAWDTFVREQEQARVQYVRFSPKYFGRRVEEPSESELTSWMNKHDKELEKEYKANKHRYTGLDKQAKVQHILIRAGKAASGDKKSQAKKQAEQILQKLRGGASFAELARKHSDLPSASNGGDLGWTPKGRRPAPFDDVVFSLEPGQVSDVVKTDSGFGIFKVEDFREGDIPKKEAKREIAENKYRDMRAEELAQKAAKETLAKWNEGLERDALDDWLASRRSSGSGKPSGEGSKDSKGSQSDSGSKSDGSKGSDGNGEDDPLKPRVRDSGLFGRTDSPITGLEDSKLVKAAFEMEDKGTLPGEPLKLGDEYVVFKLAERQHASRDDFTDKERTRITKRLRRSKEKEAVRMYIDSLRDQAEAEGEIRINEELLVYGEKAEEKQKGRRKRPIGAGF
jgi:peptidyl-prolyl cis-trans isomerase D